MFYGTRRKRYVKPAGGRRPTYAVAKYALHLLIQMKGNRGPIRKKERKN